MKKLGTLQALVVDDDEGSVIGLVSILSRHEVAVKAVQSGRAMVLALAQNAYDLIFIDRVMPEQNGDISLVIADTASRLRSQIPVVFFTGTDQAFSTPNLRHFKVLGRWNKQMPLKILENEIKMMLNTLRMTP